MVYHTNKNETILVVLLTFNIVVAMNSQEKQSDMLKSFFANIGLTNQAIAERLGGVSSQMVGAYINGKKSFGKEQAARWENLFGLSRVWLLTGEGSMLVSPTPTVIGDGNNVVAGDGNTNTITNNFGNPTPCTTKANEMREDRSNETIHRVLDLLSESKQDTQIELQKIWQNISERNTISERLISIIEKKDEQMDRLIGLLEKKEQ